MRLLTASRPSAVIDSGFAGLRPWTRAECARLVNEAMDATNGYPENSQAFRFLEQLQQEFQYEIRDMDGSTNDTFRLESAYTRVEDISGMPLTDGYTFAQTQINDFGRPYGEGWKHCYWLVRVHDTWPLGWIRSRRIANIARRYQRYL